MRTEGGGSASAPMTLRHVRHEQRPSSTGGDALGSSRIELIQSEAGWHTYCGCDVIYKRRYDRLRGKFVDVPGTPGASAARLFFFKRFLLGFS